MTIWNVRHCGLLQCGTGRIGVLTGPSKSHNSQCLLDRGNVHISIELNGFHAKERFLQSQQHKIVQITIGGSIVGMRAVFRHVGQMNAIVSSR